jgi:hypothetical protein
MERCLACEADGDQGNRDAHPISVRALCRAEWLEHLERNDKRLNVF